MADLAKSFGARVKALRTSQGLTQAQLAERMGMSDEFVRQIERGDTNPSFNTIEALSEGLEVVPAALFMTHDGGGALEHLLERASTLSPAELAWLTEAVDLVRKRPS